ncbi:hypothetical protein K1719_022787 [Acacia pycnantha]|nr:hypothetical protein K1719_022787 [Acacia pycnantha]
MHHFSQKPTPIFFIIFFVSSLLAFLLFALLPARACISPIFALSPKFPKVTWNMLNKDRERKKYILLFLLTFVGLTKTEKEEKALHLLSVQVPSSNQLPLSITISTSLLN